MIKALKDFVIVKQEYAKETTGGIVIPDTVKEYQAYHGTITYIVESVGEKYPYRLKRGDRIEMVRHEGVHFVHEGIDYWKVKEKWILGVHV